ncbi:MAG: tetratricopeptide repeat protein [Xanthomonadales bacterium]|jgi:tetratricopeptide (TPR) repeat protein|nr:tetratricopeptide repeat protein [Xanthomonadales bacterium]
MITNNKLYQKIFDEWKSGNISSAYELTRKYLDRGIESKKVNIIFVDLLISLNNFQEAKQFLDEQVNTSNTEYLHQLYLQYGHLYTKKSDIQRSISYYKKAHSIKPNDPGSLIYIAQNYYSQGDFDSSIKYFNKVLKTTKQLNDEAYFNLGLIEKSLHNYDKAIFYFEKALELDPDYYIATNQMNDCRLARNRHNK